jgi:murein DD-endopeptidase MepM/ murein hydrolase activator NlpD
MPASVTFRARSVLRAAALVVIAIGLAGCSDSGRFDVENPFASSHPVPRSDVTGAVSSRPMPSSRVSSEPLPAPGRPQTVYATGVSQGAGGLGTYRPPSTYRQPSYDVTGSVSPPRPQPPAGHWTWEGGTPVVVGRDDTVESIGRRYGVPAFAILQANGLQEGARLRPGERLVIPRYSVSAQPMPQRSAQLPPPAVPRMTAPATVAAREPASRGAELVHVVEPGETLMALSRKYHVSLGQIARANNIKPFTKVEIGDRITIPGHRAEPLRQANAQRQDKPAAPPPGRVTHVASATSAAPSTVASVPATETARVATPETAKIENPVKAAEPAGSMPSFRWPVHGRVISAFGTKPNGSQNDGINVAVPEGTPIKAADDGVVAYAGNELKGYGNLVLIRHANGYVSAYANASELLVKRGETVKRGQVIARAGQTGNVDSPQLHFEIRKGSTPVDPSRFLAQNN